MRFRRLAATAVAVLPVAIFAGAVVAQEPPPGPALTGTHTVDRAAGHVDICVIRHSELPGGNPAVHDFEFINDAWVPARDTPTDRFQAPPGWRWEPIGGGWRVYAPDGFQGGECFRLPINPAAPPPATISLIATGIEPNHQPIYSFTSQQALQSATRGAVPMHYSLGSGQVPAAGFFSAARPACGLATEFEDTFALTTRRGVLTMRQARTGDVVSGKVERNRTFRLVGETEVYVGGIDGRTLLASYAHTRAGCTQGYVARLELERAGTFVPACARPTIVAPARARVLAGARVPLRIGVTCAGSALSRWPMQVTLRDRGRTFRVGSFRTTLAPRNVTVRLGDTRPSELVVRAGAGTGLAAATKRVRLVYG